MQVLQKICWFVVLAAASSDQVTLLNTTAADKKLEALPAYKELLQTFITQEVSIHNPTVSMRHVSSLMIPIKQANFDACAADLTVKIWYSSEQHRWADKQLFSWL